MMQVEKAPVGSASISGGAMRYDKRIFKWGLLASVQSSAGEQTNLGITEPIPMTLMGKISIQL